MFNLPKSTEVNIRITKEQLYQQGSLSPKEKDLLKDNVEIIYWRNKISIDTLNVSVGESMVEFQIFEVRMKSQIIQKRILQSIQKVIPYPIVFVIGYNADVQIWIEIDDVFYHTEWMTKEKTTIMIHGINIDVMYENLIRQIADGRLSISDNIHTAVAQDQHRQALLKKIEQLEKKARIEKQPRKKWELVKETEKLMDALNTYNKNRGDLLDS